MTIEFTEEELKQIGMALLTATDAMNGPHVFSSLDHPEMVYLEADAQSKVLYAMQLVYEKLGFSPEVVRTKMDEHNDAIVRSRGFNPADAYKGLEDDPKK